MSAAGSVQAPPALAEATEFQPGARASLAAALATGPSHAYAFVGPAGSGKREAARAFAAELLADGSTDPGLARRRALADPSPHPDLTWLRPPGNQHLVEEIRIGVIGAISYRPFEGERALYVIEAADAMAEESQNALLKTLEEPPPYAHLILITADAGGLLETVRSRCQRVSFNSLPSEVVERRLAERLQLPPESIAALAALANGDLEQARFLGSERGARLRELSESCARGARAGDVAERPWVELIALAAEIGSERADAVEAAASSRADEFGKGRDAQRIKREGGEAAKRARRRERTAALDTALALTAAWFIDLISYAEGAPELARNVDRRAELEADAEDLDPAPARRAAEAAIATRRTLQVNVAEELALEALFHRIAAGFGPS